MDLTNKKILVGVSGGKDSTALALFMKENNIPAIFYFCDTGWEHPDTYKYLDYLETIIGEILRIKPKLGFKDLVLKKGIFPSRRIKFCTQHLKINPFKDEFKLSSKFSEDVICVTGERSEESPARAKKPEFEKDNFLGCYVWRPLKAWTWEDVFAIAARFGVSPNPLYKRGFKRVGCFPCIYANKAEYKALKSDKFAKTRIKEIEALEKEILKPWVILRRTYEEITGIKEILSWASDENQEDLFYKDPEFGYSCSSHYKLCE